MAILDIVDGIQVSRTVEVYGHHRAGERVRHFIYEIYQHFFNVERKNHVVARARNMFGDSFTGDLEVRRNADADCYRYSVDKVCNGSKVLPMFKKLGFKGNFHWVSPYTFFTKIQYDNRAETLLKAGQGSMFRFEITGWSNGAYRFWDSIKICIRNKYKVKDAQMYYDYLGLLARCRKDLRSPKYVCPKNLTKEHDRYVKKVREMDRKRSEAEKIRRARDNEEQYLKDKQAFFGLCFVSGDVTVKVLESVQEFVQESIAHKHCVFTGDYFKKQDSLIFSAIVKGVPVETVELSLKEMQIIQSRGLHNKASEYNEDIKKLVDRNISQVRRIYDQLQSAN
ncbi:PcfJ domain-containing protein [Sphingobacterium sp. lm-10]|uniref:PcfJ domain-containing protein n=1 Tax=Sphingobacterium sp. lm-10 TaxID=2944904 RepID=UPI002020FA43|nr:PcfJ domain-containing protein [Sphingobacterium sp. lm-10]MCL7987711.1 PcfJ domain-containing protein [Sphingobacterium sp. lm-10]